MHIRLLGPVEVLIADRSIPVAAPKQRALLALLALEAGRVVPLDSVIAGLWGQSPPASARSTVKSLASRLRGILGDAAALRAVPPGYLLDLAPDRVDVNRFEALLAPTADGATAAVSRYEAALALWRGPALADVGAADFAEAAAQRLTAARLDAVEALAGAEIALGRLPQAVERLRRHVALRGL